MTSFFPALYFLLNLLTFFLYGYDKYKARHDAWRIRETTLLLFSFFGIFGALCGSLLFRHKTRKPLFRILLPLFLLLQLLAICFLQRRFSLFP